MIKNNQHKYSISAMCKVLQLPRSTYYYEAKERSSEDDLTSKIIEVFHASRQNYGTRKIMYVYLSISLTEKSLDVAQGLTKMRHWFIVRLPLSRRIFVRFSISIQIEEVSLKTNSWMKRYRRLILKDL